VDPMIALRYEYGDNASGRDAPPVSSHFNALVHRPGENEEFASPNRSAILLAERFTADMFVPFIFSETEARGFVNTLILNAF